MTFFPLFLAIFASSVAFAAGKVVLRLICGALIVTEHYESGQALHALLFGLDSIK